LLNIVAEPVKKTEYNFGMKTKYGVSKLKENVFQKLNLHLRHCDLVTIVIQYIIITKHIISTVCAPYCTDPKINNFFYYALFNLMKINFTFGLSLI
jgi:hypothetical protein